MLLCICVSERSSLQSGDGVCYYMYPPKYKYRNSKLISRTTREGFWKPTGNARPIFSTKTGEEIGSNRTLVFYYNNKNKTCWVMYEYQLNPTDSDQQVSDHSCPTMLLLIIAKIGLGVPRPIRPLGTS